jgi:zinc D-Ala-D-Ala carboxypeptidase
MNWHNYPNFSAAEFRCKHTGQLRMDAGFMDRLQALRTDYGKPIAISSGYRDKTHPAEARKDEPGAHSTGHACDIPIRGHDAHKLLSLALKHGFTGIGIKQKGEDRFIHLDDLQHEANRPRPWVWSY